MAALPRPEQTIIKGIMKYFLFLFSFLFASGVAAQEIETSVDVRAGVYSSSNLPKPKTCANGRVITPTALSAARMPDFPGVGNLPNVCRSMMAQLKKQWMDEDLAEWNKLSNQFCSHDEGWVEKNPGACSAGGPPPICKADHWVREPQTSKDRWRKQQKEVRDKREAELKDALCGCWSDEVKKDMDKERAAMLNTYRVKTDWKIPCGFGCPPGFTCVAGLCQEENPAISIGKEIWKEGVKDAATNQLKKFGTKMEQMIGKFSSIGSKMKNLKYISGPIGLSFDLLLPTEMGTWMNAYFVSSDRLTNEMHKTYRLIQEILRAKNMVKPCNCRDPKLVYEELLQSKQQLLVEFGAFNTAYGGILTEQELDLYGDRKSVV